MPDVEIDVDIRFLNCIISCTEVMYGINGIAG